MHLQPLENSSCANSQGMCASVCTFLTDVFSYRKNVLIRVIELMSMRVCQCWIFDFIGFIVQPSLRKYSDSILSPKKQPRNMNLCPLLCCPPWIWDGCRVRGEGSKESASKKRQGLIREIRSGRSDSLYNCSFDLTANILHPTHLIQFTSIILSLFVLASPSPFTYYWTPSLFVFLSLHSWTRKRVSGGVTRKWWKIYPSDPSHGSPI